MSYIYTATVAHPRDGDANVYIRLMERRRWFKFENIYSNKNIHIVDHFIDYIFLGV